ncbi:hypothetical protein AGMMS50276_07410 [Synergistales bacterium]|nr:hypothetical protein AGMMS50276_07410 [Synergistales bacterium]
MRAYFRFYCVFMLGVVILFVLWTFISLQVGVSNVEGFAKIIEWKKNYADGLKHSKFILSSGSNGLYGVDTSWLEKSLNVPFVNFAISQPLGLYNLYIAGLSAVSGDIIVAPLEYEMYTNNIYLHEIIYVIAYDRDYLRTQSIFQKLRFIMGLSLTEVLQKCMSVFFPPKIAEITETEKVTSTLNRNGDETSNIEQKLETPQGPSKPLTTPNFVSSSALRRLSDFIDECRASGVTFIAAYPSLLYDEVYDSGVVRKNISDIQAFYKSKNVPILGTFEESLYPIEDMYDTVYHLNSDGRAKRTERMLRDLRETGIAGD